MPRIEQIIDWSKDLKVVLSKTNGPKTQYYYVRNGKQEMYYLCVPQIGKNVLNGWNCPAKTFKKHIKVTTF